jgi:hypothetical protein
MDFERAALSLIGSFIVCFLFWPRKLPLHFHLQVMKTEWMEEEEIYEAVHKLCPAITLNQHNRILARLLEQNAIEECTPSLHEIQEIEALNEFGRTHIDRALPFTTVLAKLYRLAPHDGGRARRTREYELAVA